MYLFKALFLLIDKLPVLQPQSKQFSSQKVNKILKASLVPYHVFSILQIASLSSINPFRSDPERREKINLIFYFHTSFWCRKRFYEGL